MTYCLMVIRSAAKCSIEDHVVNRQMPEGGLQALQSTVLADLAWAQGLPTDFRLVEKETYRRLISLLVSGMYVLAPQGRIEAFTTLTLLTTQQQLMLPGGCALSNTFKTYEKYGYQPISLPSEMHSALNVYVALRRRIGTASELLFIDHTGKPYSSTKLGSLVTQYFRSTMDLHLTTTMIRSLWEIMSDKALKAEVISPAQRAAVMNINGHSSQTTKDYYLRTAREEDARRGSEVRNAILQHDVQLLDAQARSTASANMHAWGTAHPCFSAPSPKRVKWTDFEKEFVVSYCNDVVARSPELGYKAVGMCLDFIKSDPALVAQFHAHHTLESRRLSQPWKEWKQRQHKLDGANGSFDSIQTSMV
jgi:hypothetical protein